VLAYLRWLNGAYVFCDHLIVSLSSLSLWGRYTLIALILVPTVRDVNPYIGQSSANIRSIFFDSGTLENVKTKNLAAQKYSAYGHELWLDRPTLDVMPRSKDIERSG
jgi:hypothetical protein